MIRGLIFDFDGLLLDTEVPVYESWRENYAAFGRDLPLELYTGCVGSDFTGFDPKRHLEEQLGEPVNWEHWDRVREERALEMANALAPMPGAVDLLGRARDSGLPCAVASSSPRSWVEPHLERTGLRPFFRLTRCSDDVERIKPSPDLFLAAAEGLSVSPSEAVVLEDSLNGLIAARAAGIRCIIVPNRITGHLDFAGAHAVLPSLDDFSI